MAASTPVLWKLPAEPTKGQVLWKVPVELLKPTKGEGNVT